MAFEKPGGLVWGGERQPTEVTFTGQTMRLAAASMAAGALGYGATRTLQSGYRPIDVFYAGSRVAGDLSPASFLNTFRTPEWLSPFASNKALGISDGVFEWDLTSLSKGGAYTTQKYLEATTGLTSHELHRRGVSLQDGRNKALKLKFVREKDAVHGSLYAVTEAGEHLLNNRQMLMEANPAAVSGTKRNLSKAAMSVMQSLNLTADPLFNPDLFGVRELGLNADGVADLSHIPRFMPVPGVGVPGSWDEAKRMSSFLRAPSAFGMERPNELLKSTFEQVPLLGDVAKKLKTNLGFGLSVTPGPASHMFMRYGMLGMGAGAAVLGYQQLDYLHREGAIEHVAAITASSAGIGYLAHRLGGGGLGARGALGVAAGAWAFQSLMPGFKEGITSGVISTYQTANIVRAAASPFNTQRRVMEGMFPGISSVGTGALLGGGLLAASYFAMPIVGRIPQKLLDDSRFGHKWLGIESSVQIGGGKVTPFVPKSVREIFWDEVEQHVSTLKGYSHTSQTTFNKVGMGKAKLLWTLGNDTGLNMGNNIELAGKLRKMWGDAVHQVDESASKNPMNFSLESKLRKIDAKYAKDFSPVAKVSRFAEGWLESTKHAFFGADPLEKEFVERVSKIGFSPKMGRAALLFGAAMLFQQVVTGGFVGSMETVKELQGQYEGRNLVEIKRGRWWEGGSNPIGGEQSGSYFRPHASYLMKNRVREKGIWGEEADTLSPISRFFLGNFTYHLEEKNYYDRPYPISGAAFENVPIIGRLLGATVGRLIKPATIMHADEWMREGENGLEYSDNYAGWKREPAYNLGAKPTGLPYHKLGSEKLFGQTIATFRELEGFTGWLKNTVQDQITGSSTFFGQEPNLASSAEITSPVRAFWDMNMGGALFSNELARRFLSKDYGSGKKVNPITNSMPTWMPVKLRHGDPYASIEWGEARLPGAGFVAMHPELKGVDPQDYPLVYQYSILADVAPFSPELEMTRRTLYMQRQKGLTNENENQYMDYIGNVLNEKTKGVDSNRVAPHAIEIPLLSRVTQRATFGVKSMIQELAAPGEYLIPMGFRPTHKLIGDRSPIQEYEYQRLYGSQTAFWDKPWRDWFRPSMYSAMHVLGYEGKPAFRQEANEVNQQFDKVDFYKWMKLAEESEAAGNVGMATRYRYMANNTRTGVNPQGTPMGIYWSLPAEDRPFFNAFANAQGAERTRIMEMVPEDQVGLYQAVWNRVDQKDPGMWAGSTTRMSDQYLAGKFSELKSDANFMQSLPQEDWVGYLQDVDMNDIKAKYVDHIGRDLHDFGLWERTLQGAESQPYLDGSEAPMVESVSTVRNRMTSNLTRLMRGAFQGPSIVVNSRPSIMGGVDAQLTLNDDRYMETRMKLRGWNE